MSRIEFQKAHTYEDALMKAADESQVDRGYWDIFHRRHEVSPEVRRGILNALGRDVSNREALERERQQRFRENANSVLPRTAVISESQRSLPLNLPGSQQAVSVFFVLSLE